MRCLATACALSVCALSACAPDAATRTPLSELLEDVDCEDVVWDVLSDLGAGSSYIQAPPGADGSRSVRIPTARFAEWVAMSLPTDEAPVLHLTTPHSTREIRFGERCGVTSTSVPVQISSADTPLFTDANLRALMNEDPDVPLVVYVWAPHMPLSADGWPEIDRASTLAGMRAVPALIAHSDRVFAEREAERVGMPDDGLREIASIELVSRQAQVHAPSIVIFGRDRVSPVLPGYRNADGYLQYLEAFKEGR